MPRRLIPFIVAVIIAAAGIAVIVILLSRAGPTPAVTRAISTPASISTSVPLPRLGGRPRPPGLPHSLLPGGAGPRDVAVEVRLRPKLLMTPERAMVTWEDVRRAEHALAWVLWVLFAYAERVGVKRAVFWKGYERENWDKSTILV